MLAFEKYIYAKGWNYQSLAHASGLSKDRVRNWGHGKCKPTFDCAHDVAKTLGITMDQLYALLTKEVC